MKIIPIKICVVIALLLGSVGMGFSLPDCGHDDPRNWHMCTQKIKGKKGVEGENYRYIFRNWKRGEPERVSKYQYFNGDRCTCETESNHNTCIGAATYHSSNGKAEKVKSCPQSREWMQSILKRPELVPASPASTNTTILKNAFKSESLLRRKQIQYALKKLNYYTSSIDALYGPGTERALTGYANAKGLNGHSPHSIFSSVLNQVSVPSSFAVAKRSNNSSSSSSSSSSGGSSAGRTLLQGLFVAGACSLTSNPGACLDGATGNNRSSNTGSSSPKTLSSGTWIKSGNTYIGPGGEAVFDNGRVIQGTDGSLCHRTRNAIICQ